jgi:orotate phosphoribosyltransferase
MPEQEVLPILQRVGALITNSHVVYTSGRHGSRYINKDALFPHTAETSQICALLAAHFAAAEVEVVAGPTIGGVIMAQWVAHHLSQLSGRPVLAVYAEEEGSGAERRRVFRRGYGDLLTGRRVLAVEDVLTTGGSVRMVIAAIKQQGGDVVGLGALYNRGGLQAAALGVPDFYALLDIPIESWDAADCPLCQAGTPINTSVGKGAAFLAKANRQEQ